MKKAEEKMISRGLDGELTGPDRFRLEQMLAGDEQARQVHRTWEKVGDQLRRDTGAIPAPDPALAWQDIRRAIRQQESVGEQAAPAGFFARLRWAGAVAAVAVVGVMGWSALRLWQDDQPSAHATWNPPAERVEWVIAEIPGATTMIYTDLETDMTVIWMDIAQNANPRDT